MHKHSIKSNCYSLKKGQYCACTPPGFRLLLYQLIDIGSRKYFAIQLIQKTNSITWYPRRTCLCLCNLCQSTYILVYPVLYPIPLTKKQDLKTYQANASGISHLKFFFQGANTLPNKLWHRINLIFFSFPLIK